jgi:hypothetical protein
MARPRRIPRDALSRDVVKDLERVDKVMGQVIADPSTTDEFVRDPSGVLARLGLHPRTSRAIHNRANRIFYAVLANTDLTDLVADRIAGFRPEDADERVLDAALRRGEIEHPLQLDMAAFAHFTRDPTFLRRVFQITLHDLNDRRILENHYSAKDIDDYIDRVIDAIQARRPIRDFPVLEAWDNNYGIGLGQGDALFAEVGPIATLGIFVEVGAIATVWVGADSDLQVKALSREVFAEALRGDPDAARKLATVGALLKLAGEVHLHAINFERR